MLVRGLQLRASQILFLGLCIKQEGALLKEWKRPGRSSGVTQHEHLSRDACEDELECGINMQRTEQQPKT